MPDVWPVVHAERQALADDLEGLPREAWATPSLCPGWDVHDVLGHSLTVVTVKTELAARLIDFDPERAKQEMAQVQDLARQALAEIRATVGGRTTWWCPVEQV